jgi:stage II sporulation protein R
MKKRIAAVLAMATICVLLLGTIQTQQLQQNMANKVLRFHVLANSDAKEDQELKIQVRDAVGTLMAEKLKNADSLEKSEEIVQQSLEEIEQTAEKIIVREGYTYPVQAMLTNCVFPEKNYGMFTFPAGNYQALRVVIGAGEGQNWWCVMYPNLCFSGSMYEVDAQSQEKLREVLTGEEYSAVLEEGNYTVKFKILEIMNRVLE